ncbi:MAG: hypothetical protein ABIO55_15830 [Ginsengibacter sp.]
MIWEKNTNPFVGLRPFESDESLLFFGRQEQTLELLQRLHQHHFVAVVGSSGSGKSSLIRAGLIPSLKAGYLVDDLDRWVIAIMKPGQGALYNLAEAILNQLELETDVSSVTVFLKKIKEQGADAVVDSIKHLWKKKNTNFFLLVDQFEELFRFSMEQSDVSKKDDATDFVNIILELSRQTDLPVYVVITMRSDFIGDCAQFYSLPEAMNQSQYLVPRLNRVQLKSAIEGPVKLYGGKINAALTSRLLNDSGTVKDELPLLQHALMRVWDHEINLDKNGELDLKDYESIGGIEKALSNHADEALSGMSEEELSLSKKIFQALTTIDENGRKIRRPVRLKELEEITKTGKEELLAIINLFIEDKRSFLVINRTGEQDDYVIDISHESLIRQWYTLNGWVDEEAEASKNYLRLVESSNLYRDKRKDFLSGSELQLALKWCSEFKPVQVWAQRYNKDFEGSMRYLQESEKECLATEHMRKVRKRNQLIFIIGFVASIIFVLFFYGIERAQSNAREAEHSRQQAHIADSLKAIAIKTRQEAEKQRDTALFNVQVALQERRRADSSAAIAIRAQYEALLLKGKAEISAAEARTQTLRAKDLLARVGEQKEAFRLISLARQKVSEDPTIALRIAEAAMKIDPDLLIFQEAHRIYELQDFYKTIVKSQESAQIISQVISRDGTKILNGCNDSKARLWNINGTLIKEFTGHTGDVNCVVFSSDEKKILTGSSDNTARLWDINGTPLQEFKGYGSSISSVDFSPDGKIIFIGSFDGKARLLRSIDGSLIKEFDAHNNGISFAAFSADGKKLVTSSWDSTAKLWDTEGTLIKEFRGHKANVNTVAFSPDGTKILTGSSDKTARLWSVDDTLVTVFEGHTDFLGSVAFSSDGQKILTGSNDKTARLWTIDGLLLQKFTGHTDVVNTVGFLPDGNRILTGSVDSTARIWNIAGVPLKEFKGHTDFITSLAFSPDGTKVITGAGYYDKTARLWSINGVLLRDFKGHALNITSVAFSPDATKVLTGSSDKTARIWNLDGSLFLELEHPDAVTSVAFSPDGTKVLTGSSDKIARLWNLDSSLFLEFKGHTDVITSVAFSSDGKKILTGCRDSIARLWRWNVNDTAVKQFKGNISITSVGFSRDGKTILIGTRDGTTRLSNIDGTIRQDFKGQPGFINSVAFSPDEKKILAGSSLWDIDGSLLSNFPGVTVSAFSPDGKTILTGSDDGIVRLWNTLKTLEDFLKSDEIEALTEQQKKEFGIIK